MEALFKREKFGADLLPLAAQQAGMRTGQLERAFPRFGAGVGEENPVESGTLREPQRQLCLPFVKKQIRSVDQCSALPRNRFFDRRMPVAQRIHADAGQQIEIEMAISSSIR